MHQLVSDEKGHKFLIRSW